MWCRLHNLDACKRHMGGGQETVDLFGALWDATGMPIWLQNNKPPTGPTIPTPTLIPHHRRDTGRKIAERGEPCCPATS